MDYPYEKNIDKAIDIVLQIGGGLFGPWHTLRQGKAFNDVKADEIRKIAQGEKDAEDIKAGKKCLNEKGILEVVHDSNPSIRTPETQRKLWELEQDNNLRKILISSITNVEENPRKSFSDKPVEQGWLTRWRKNAQNIFDKDLQELWAKILAGEIQEPGTYSLFTIDFLANLSKEDAETIQKIGEFVFDDGNIGFIFYQNREFFHDFGVTFSHLLELEDLGILNLSGGRGVTLEIKSSSEKGNSFLVSHKEGSLNFLLPPGSKKFTFYLIKLTKVGTEIFSLGDFNPNKEYLDMVIQYFKTQGCKVYSGKIIENEAGVSQFQNEKEL